MVAAWSEFGGADESRAWYREVEVETQVPAHTRPSTNSGETSKLNAR